MPDTPTGDWEGFPPLGSRVRVPWIRTHVEGEVVWYYHLNGRPVAWVAMAVPTGIEPGETHPVKLRFGRDEMEVLPPDPPVHLAEAGAQFDY